MDSRDKVSLDCLGVSTPLAHRKPSNCWVTALAPERQIMISRPKTNISEDFWSRRLRAIFEHQDFSESSASETSSTKCTASETSTNGIQTDDTINRLPEMNTKDLIMISMEKRVMISRKRKLEATTSPKERNPPWRFQ
jgi:hypothetical protein